MSLEERIRQRVEALAANLASGIGQQLKIAADELAAAAAEERVATEAEAMARFADDLAHAREEAERATHDAVKKARAETEQKIGAELQRARAQIDGLTEDAARLVGDAERYKTDAERLKADLDRHKTDADRLKSDLERHKADAERHKADAERSRAEADGQKTEAERQRSDAQRYKTEAERYKTETGRHKTEADQARQELARTHDDAQRFKKEAEQLRRAAEQLKAAQAGRERETSLAGLDRLASSIRRIDAANTLTDVLAALAAAAAAETARVALLLAAPGGEAANGQRLKPWRLSGFPAPPPAFDLPLARAGELARTGLPFAPLGANRAGLALPIDVGGQTVAVLYADAGNADQASPPLWPDAIEILARHAAARLEAFTAVRTAQVLGVRPVATIGNRVAPAEDEQGARRYAKLLISEIKLYNESAVRLGRDHRDIYDRLRSEIDRARRLFEERVPPNLAGRQTYFDDELVQTLADGDASLLGVVPK